MKMLQALTLLTAATAMTVDSYGQVTYQMGPASPVTVTDGSYEGVTIAGLSTPALDTSKTWSIESVHLTLTAPVSGTSGDIYAKIVYGAAGEYSSILLNRPGRTSSSIGGYANNSLDFTFYPDSKAGLVDSHYYQTSTDPSYSLVANNVTGSFLVDGRDTNPTTTVGTEPRTKLLSGFNGLNMNGNTWKLFVSDLSPGGQYQVTSWSVTFTDVPEPSQYAMLAGLGLVGFAAYRRYRVKTA